MGHISVVAQPFPFMGVVIWAELDFNDHFKILKVKLKELVTWR